MFKSGLTFILSHIDIKGDLPISLAENYHIRAARDNEIEQIDNCLQSISIHPSTSSSLPLLLNHVRYRQLVKEENYGTNKQYHFEDLPREKWKYWVIAFEGNSRIIRELEHASTLLPIPLDFGMTFMFSETDQRGHLSGHSSIPLHLVEEYADYFSFFENAKPVNSSEIQRIKLFHELNHSLPKDADFIKQALKNFYATRAIPKSAGLRVVGYFSIIEALITHHPRRYESLNSITHQIVNKLLLLSKRFSRRISTTNFFSHAADEKIWGKLYSYRSRIAHGGTADFKDEFQLLKTNDAVVNFLSEILKELIILALNDHEFIMDLKKC